MIHKPESDFRYADRPLVAVNAVELVNVHLDQVTHVKQPLARWAGMQFKKHVKFQFSNDAEMIAILRRFADACLLGNSVVSFGDPIFGAASYIGADAQSKVNITPGNKSFGTGPIKGTFDLLTDFNGGDVDHLSDLAVVASGKLDGMLDLRPALDPKNPQPIAPVSGKWRLTTVGNQRGTFQGAFLIATDLSAFSLPGDWYIQPDNLQANCISNTMFPIAPGATACLLDSTEYVLGIPLTKAVIFLVK